MTKDRNPFVRVNAVTALGVFRAPRGTTHCLAALKDEYVLVQYAAVTALGRLGTPEALVALLGLAEDPASPLRQRALTALADPAPFPPFILTAASARLMAIAKSALAETDVEPRAAGVRLLGKVGGQEAWRTQCFDLLAAVAKDPVADVRLAVQQALAGLLTASDPRAVTLVLDGLQDPEEEVVSAACRRLDALQHGDAETVRRVKPVLIGLLQRADMPAAGRLCGIVAGFKDADYVPALLAALRKHAQLCVVATSAIDEIGPTSLEPVTAAARDTDPAMRAAAAFVLSHARNLPQPVDLLARLLCDPEPAVRKAAITGELKPDPRYTDMLVVLLHDPDAQVRQAAILRLRFPALRALREPLKACLRDPAPEVRGAAAISLGWLPTAEMIDAVLPCLRDADATVRESALWAVIQHADPRIGPALLPLLADPEMRVRRTAVSAALRQPGTYPALLEAVRVEPVADTRREMIEMLGRDRDVRALPLLIDASQHDKELEVRRAATWALGCLHEAAAYEPLLVALQAPEDGVKDAAKSALATLGDRRIVEVLCNILASGKDSWVTEPLQTLNDPRIPALVEPLLTSKYPHVRDQALMILLARGHPRAVEVFTARWQAAKTPQAKNALLRYLNGYIRPLPPALIPFYCEAVQQGTLDLMHFYFLADAGFREVIPVLITRLAVKDPESQVPQMAAQALGILKATEAVDGILPLLQHPSAQTRRSAARALGKIGDLRAVNALDAVARTDVDAYARLEAMEALHHLGDPRGMTGLLAAMTDTALRRRAAWTLGQLPDPRAREALATALDDEDTGIRYAAAIGLLKQGDRRGAPACLALQRTASIGSEDDDTLLNLFVAVRDPATVAPLLTMTREGTLPARIFALRALGGLQAKEGVPLLQQALGDEFTLVREAAAKGLGVAADPDGVAPLIAALTDPSSKVREAAVASLGQLKARKAIEPLQALLVTETSTLVRDAADKALHEIVK